MNTEREVRLSRRALPPILLARSTPEIAKQVEQFCLSLAEIFESWVNRHRSPHTQRAYRRDVQAFLTFLGVDWPAQATALLTASVQDVQAFRDSHQAHSAAPKTINRRIASVSSFYKYLAAAVAELRLPITVPNP